jgi:hypothetical protein
MEGLHIGDAADPENCFRNTTNLPAPFQFGASRNERKIAEAFARMASFATDLVASLATDLVHPVVVYEAAVLVRVLHVAFCALDKARRTKNDDLALSDAHSFVRCLLKQCRPLVFGLPLPFSRERRLLKLRVTEADIRAATVVIDEVNATLRLQDLKRSRKYAQAPSDVDILLCLVDGHSTHSVAAEFGLHQSSVHDRTSRICKTLDKRFQALIPIQTRQKARPVHNSRGHFAPSGRVCRVKRRPNPWGVGTKRDEYRKATAKFVAATAAIRVAYPEDRVVRLPPGTVFSYYDRGFPRPRTRFTSINTMINDGEEGKIELAELIGAPPLDLPDALPPRKPAVSTSTMLPRTGSSAPGAIWVEELADQKAHALKIGEKARCSYVLGNIGGSIEPKDDATLLRQGANSLLVRRLPPPAKRLGDIGNAAAQVPLDANLLPNEINRATQGRWGEKAADMQNGDDTAVAQAPLDANPLSNEINRATEKADTKNGDAANVNRGDLVEPAHLVPPVFQLNP